MIDACRRNGAKTQKGFKSFKTLKNITKCRENSRISTEKFRKTYLSIHIYFLSYYISNTKHIHSISGGRVTRAKCLHGKIFISPMRYPASFCWELTKASYSAASCKQSPGITISFYNSRDLAITE